MGEWITNIVDSLGYLGIGLLMFLENLFPPIPSELIMPLAGFTASQGKLALIPAIAAGVVGTILGALPWYYLGKFWGEEGLKAFANKYGKWVSLSVRDIDRADNWFDKQGGKAVFLGRLIPGVRTLISLPAGINGMPLVPFILYSTLGTTLWVGILTFAGYTLGKQYYLVEKYIGPIAKIVIAALLVGFILWIVLRKRRKKNKKG
ncbi:MAG: DedA family protein [Kastovskya adunca ATA6-11-RM4]|jgi:membrane protein DedA with SNARE-associated domain|nr:DedA family protein [Kastovskya adunca ATA6-11-RM4]